jgi:hypothetical protein
MARMKIACPSCPPFSIVAKQVQAAVTSVGCSHILFHGTYRCHFGLFVLVLILVGMLFASVGLCTNASRLRLAICLLLVIALLLFLSS